MNIYEYGLPRPHVIIDDVMPFDINQQMVNEALSLPLEKGRMYSHIKDEYYFDDTKNANDLTLTEFYKHRREDSVILSNFDKFLWSSKTMDMYASFRYPIFNTLTTTKEDVTNLIRYGDGQYYNTHTDINHKKPTQVVTISYMMCKEPKCFSGGDFILKWNEEEKVIPFKNNRLILFSCNTKHKVTPVKMETDDKIFDRFAVQWWAS